MKIIKIYTIVLGIFCLFLISACEGSENQEILPIKVGKGETTLENVNIGRNSEKNILLYGGNGKYSVAVADQRVAKVWIVEDTLKIKGILEGSTYATIHSHDLKANLNINTIYAKPYFTRSELRLYPAKSVKREIVTLYGGSLDTELIVEDPMNILNVEWNGLTGKISILAEVEGDAVIIAKSKTGEQAKLDVTVRAEEQPVEYGIYVTNERWLYYRLKAIYTAYRQGNGLIMSNLASPKGGRFSPSPYSLEGTMIRIEPIVNPVVGEFVDVKIHRVAGTTNIIPEGVYNCVVDRVTDDAVQLRNRDYKFFIPYESR